MIVSFPAQNQKQDKIKLKKNPLLSCENFKFKYPNITHVS